MPEISWKQEKESKMKRGLTIGRAVLALLALVMLTAPVFAAGQQEVVQAEEAKKIRIALGDIESVEVLHLLIGIERVKEKGVDIEMISYKSEDVASQAVVNGQADIGIGTPYGMIQNVGAPIRIFFQLSMVNFFPVVNTNYYDNWQDLDGEEMVVHSRTSGTLALVQLMAQKHNIEYGKLSYIPGSEVRALSMLNENIKATIIDSYNKEFLLKQDPDRFKVLPMEPLAASDEALYANLNFLQNNEDTVQIFIEELISTVKEINADPEKVLELREKYGLLEDLPKDLEGEILPFYELAAEAKIFREDGGGARAARQDFELYGAAGEIKGDPATLKVEDFWYLKPLENALGN